MHIALALGMGGMPNSSALGTQQPLPKAYVFHRTIHAECGVEELHKRIAVPTNERVLRAGAKAHDCSAPLAARNSCRWAVFFNAPRPARFVRPSSRLLACLIHIPCGESGKYQSQVYMVARLRIDEQGAARP